jgi:hypothetical protein
MNQTPSRNLSVTACIVSSVISLTAACSDNTPCRELYLHSASASTPGYVRLLVGVDDCRGNAIDDLTADDFIVREAGRKTLEATPAVSQKALKPVITLLIDTSSSLTKHRPTVVDAAKRFVAQLFAASRGSAMASTDVYLGVELFAGERDVTTASPHIQVTASSQQRIAPILDGTLDHHATDPVSTNLNGAIVTSLASLTRARHALEAKGVLTAGYLLVFSDGRDTAKHVTTGEATQALAGSRNQARLIKIVDPDGDNGDLGGYLAAAGALLQAPSEDALIPLLEQVARWVRQQAASSYLVEYCSPARAGTTSVTVNVRQDDRGQTEPPIAMRGPSAIFQFNADGFGPGCVLASPASRPGTDAGRMHDGGGADGDAGDAGISTRGPDARAARWGAGGASALVVPNVAIAGGGGAAVLRGSGFAASDRLTIGGKAVNSEFVSNSRIDIIVPALQAGRHAVTLHRQNGSVIDGGFLEVADVIRFVAPKQHPAGPSSALDDWADIALFVATLQGNANRDGVPRLFIDATTFDATWWARMRAAGQTLANKRVIDVRDPIALYSMLRHFVKGAVVYDPAVNATVNVATTVAGADDLVALRHSTRPTSFYQRLMTEARPSPPAVKIDLVGRFSGSGNIWQTGRPSSGSRKGDAYLWLADKYIKTRKLRSAYVGYFVDDYWRRKPLGVNNTQIYNRDFLVAERGLVFDLSTWTEQPVDDPMQPRGTDRAVLLELLRGIYDLHGGSGFTQVIGFTPWAWKYTNHEGAGGSHDPVATEWDLARILSAYNMGVDADALAMTALANATVYRHAVIPAYRAPAKAPSRRRLRDIGAWDNRLRNPGFDDDASAGGWQVAVSDSQTIVDAKHAHHGVHYLNVSARRDHPSNSVAQTVSVNMPAGQRARASIWVRAATGSGQVVLALWSLDGGPRSESTVATLSADGKWHRLEVALEPDRSTTRLKLEVYVPVGAASFDLDSAALWIEQQPKGVSPRRYIVWHMADYDSAAWLYQMTLETWDDPRRGEVPLSWAFNPNLIDRFAPLFAHAWQTATTRDHFTAADTVASYVNVTQLSGARQPSGLADGRQAFEMFARPYLQRTGLTSTLMALNGSAGPFDDPAFGLLTGLCVDGVGYNRAQQPDNPPRLINRVPVIAHRYDLPSDDLNEAAVRVHNNGGRPAPDFAIYRTVQARPGYMADLTARIVKEQPRRLYTVVSPKEFFRLAQLHLGQTPTYRASFIKDTLPRRGRASTTVPFSVTLRNDGWDSWPAGGTIRIGAHFSSTPIAPRSLPSAPGEYPQRFALPAAVPPGAEVTVNGALNLPSLPGRYFLQLDVVHERVTWFESQNSLPHTHRLTVDPPAI